MSREQRIYDAVIDLCISRGVGNIASEISRLVTFSLYDKNALTIYKALTTIPQSTGDISLKTGIPSNHVSSILSYMYKKTTFIKFEREGKLKYWSKI